MSKKQKIVVSVSGASGAIYAKVLFDRLQQLHNQVEEIGVLMSDNAKYVWKKELGNTDYKKPDGVTKFYINCEVVKTKF